MFKMTVNKIVARNGAREVTESSFEEKENFIAGRIRPEFDDEDIIAVKFSCDDDETSWFINPVYIPNVPEPNTDDTEDSEVFDRDFEEFFSYRSYGPKMAAEYLPELLTMVNDTEYRDLYTIFRKYDDFLAWLIHESVEYNDEEKLKIFLDRFQEWDD